MQENATLDEPLAEELLRAPEAAHLCTKIELQRLTEKEYKRTVVRGIIKDLDLSFAKDLGDERVAKQIAPAFWQRTGYNWQHINEFVAYVRQTVPVSKETGRRLVNRAVLEKLLQCSFVDLEQVTPENDI